MMTATPTVYTVSQLNARIANLINADRELQAVFVEGELSNVNINSKSGHMYFSVTREGAGSMNNAFYLPCNAFAVLEISKRLFYLDGCGTGHFRKKGGII